MSLFDKFKTATKTIKVKALENQEVTIREFTLAESEYFFKKLVGEPTADGKMQFNTKEIFSIRLEKVDTALVEPKIELNELRELSESASEAIGEIADAIEEFSTVGKNKKK